LNNLSFKVLNIGREDTNSGLNGNINPVTTVIWLDLVILSNLRQTMA
jgi:hypothetical protein